MKRATGRIINWILVGLVAGCAARPQNPTVTIHRDDWGVPHIYAETEELGYYGLGYAQAEDQLIKLLGAIHWLRGRQAELEGGAHLAVDIEQRRWRHAQEGVEGFARLSPQLQNNYRSFVAGMRRYMADHPDKVPAWAPEFDASDFVGISRAIFWIAYAGVEGLRECLVGGADLQASVIDVLASATTGASNGWVVAPERTKGNATILVADPHVEMQSPAYYEFRMEAGTLKSSGYAVGPLLWQVHTRHVSWAMTTGNTDMWDCYQVEVDPENPRRYRFDDEWREMIVHNETFGVRGGEPVSHTFEYTRHNDVMSPVVGRQGNTAYVVSTSQMHDAGLIDEEIYRMNHAGSVAELREAMKLKGMFPQNLIMGDSSGNIFYVRAGKTPRRPEGHDWSAPVPGNSSATAWQGYHAFSEQIQVLNPPQNYIQNNNVAPDRLFPKENLSAADYPKYLFNDTPGRVTSRGLRSIEVLSAASDFTLEDAVAHAFDEKWITTDTWQRALRTVVERFPHLLESRPEQTRAFVQRLLDFDGFASADSVGALNFFYWRSGMWEVFSRSEFEHLRHLPWANSAFTEEFGEALLERAQRAVDEMVEEVGSTDVPMGKVFRVGRGERSWPLGGESINLTEMPGCIADITPLCERTIRAFASRPPDERGQRRAYRGSNAMRLVVFSDPIQSYSLHVYGQSDNPESPHYDDQARLLSERKFKPTYFYRDELEGHIESTTVLELPQAPPTEP